MKPRPQSVINYPELQAQRARLGITYEDLIELTGAGLGSIAAVMNGKETVNLQTIIRIAAALGLLVKVEFEPMPVEKQNPTELRKVA